MIWKVGTRKSKTGTTDSRKQTQNVRSTYVVPRFSCHYTSIRSVVSRMYGGDDRARTRDLCRDSTEANSNLLKLSVTDGFFWRSKAHPVTLIGPLTGPRPLPQRPLPNVEIALLIQHRAESQCHKARWKSSIESHALACKVAKLYHPFTTLGMWLVIGLCTRDIEDFRNG
jgi:hypothetical protein